MPRPLIDDKRKIIFIHIPKNAGTSIRQALQLNEKGCYEFNGHPPQDYYKKNHPREWKEYFKFAVIRNPWDRFWDSYKYAIANDSYWRRRVGLPHQDRETLLNVPFLTLCKEFHKFKDKLIHPCWKPQSYWLFDWETGELVVDIILRMETIDQTFPQLAVQMGWGDINLERVNTDESGIEGSYKDAFKGDQEAIEAVEEIMSPDTKQFLYEF